MNRPTLDIDLNAVARMASDYAVECNAAGRAVSIKEFAARLGKGPMWLSHPFTEIAKKSRQITLEEWHREGVKATRGLASAIEKALEPDNRSDWAIPQSSWPHHTELPRILATPGRRDMFMHLRNEYGRAAAMRYAYVCANPSAKGADRNWSKARGVGDAVV